MSKSIKTRIQNKHDVAENWQSAVNFVPLAGEIIVYEPDATHNVPRVKIGDGVKTVNQLDFIDVNLAAADHTHPTDTTRAAQKDFEEHLAKHAPADAEKNQNAFSNIIAGSTTIAANSSTDSLTIAAGSNIIITPDEADGKITIAATDTTYSAGEGVAFSGTTISNAGVRAVSAGSTNGTIKVNTNGVDTEVAIKGLGSAAYAQKGMANGVAELDAAGKVPSSQLPSYVDDVIESVLASFPEIGEAGKIYVDTETNKTYRWSGSVYTEISASLALGETSSTAYRGDLGCIAYEHSQADHARTDATCVTTSATNGNINIDGTDTTVYTHPEYDSKSSGLYKITVDSTGHIREAEEVKKSDITALGIPGQDTTYNTGTDATSGLTKLYVGTGNNTDGTMTQSAITSALNSKEASGAAANALSEAKAYVTSTINNLIGCGTSDPSAAITSKFYFKYSTD